jgi:hypothetical protein
MGRQPFGYTTFVYRLHVILPASVIASLKK